MSTPHAAPHTLQGAVGIDIMGQALQLLPGRAAYWPDAATLIVADVHLGKAQVLRHHGIPVPRGSTRENLDRLDALIADTRCRRLLVLGDLVHAPGHVDLPWRRRLANWRRDHAGLSMTVIAGNHDRGQDLSALGFDPFMTPLREDPFVFAHAPGTAIEDGLLRLCGHIHPAIVRSDHAGRLRIPVFWRQPHQLVLPAFGALTGGFEITPSHDDRIYAVTSERVIPLALRGRPSIHASGTDSPSQR